MRVPGSGQVAGEIGGTVIYKTGLVITETKEKVGNMIDATQDYVANTTVSINPDTLQLGPVTIPFMRLRLLTQAAPQFAGKLVAPAGAAGQPAYAWMTVMVPADAGFLAFDFTVTGQPVDDRIVCAINDQNVFNLPAKFAPDNVPSSTDLIDVSAFAGQNIELFSGLRAAHPRTARWRLMACASSPCRSQKLASSMPGPIFCLSGRRQQTAGSWRKLILLRRLTGSRCQWMPG